MAEAATYDVPTSSRAQMVDITGKIREEVKRSGISEGICVVYVPHTTAGITINENADPSVQSDLGEALDRLVPWEGPYRHTEGNSAAHVKSTLVGCSKTIPVEGGSLLLGTWQGIYFCEFDGPRTRKCHVEVTGG